MNNLLVVGRFGSPYGIKGWVKVISFTQPIEKIFEYSPWYVASGTKVDQVALMQGRVHGENLVVHLKNCNDRDKAQTYTNKEILIDRSQLPVLSEDEYYWVDLIGLKVFNTEAKHLGKVLRLFATGANDVLVVKDDTGKERYIPYIEHVIVKVDLAAATLIVDWDETF